MGNNINNDYNIIISANHKVKTNIICPKCPLIPIINITTTKEGTIICEYRCPSFHMGLIKLEEMIISSKKTKSKSKESSIKCLLCKIDLSQINKNTLKFCGICKDYICDFCIENHNKTKSNHKIINYNKINSLCLIHANKIKFYCFTCLRNLCTKCIGHKNHCFKELKEIEPNEEFLEKMEFYFKEIFPYFSSIEKNLDNNELDEFTSFKEKNLLLIYFLKDLYQIYLNKKEKKILNGETIINILNLSQFNLDTKNFLINKNMYLKNHLILKNTSVSNICSFTNTKANYKIGELMPVFFKYLNIEKGSKEKIKVLRMDYDLIAYSIGKMLYFMKNEEKVYFHIKINEKIENFYQLKDHIVTVLSKDNAYFYKLLKIKPYIVEINCNLPNRKNILQIYGSINDKLYILTNDLFIQILIRKKTKLKKNNNDILLDLKSSIQFTEELNSQKASKNIKSSKNDSCSDNKDLNNNSNNQNNDSNYNNLNDLYLNNNYLNDSNYNNSNNSDSNNNNDNVNNYFKDNDNDDSNQKNDNDNDNGNYCFKDSDNDDSNQNNDNHYNNYKVNNKFKKNNSNYLNSNYINKENYNERNEINLDQLNNSINNINNTEMIIKKLKKYEENNISKYEENKNKSDILIIKGIIDNYMIFKNNDNISINYIGTFKYIKSLRIDNRNFIIYNNHILISNNKVIEFLSVPDLLKVSEVEVSFPIIDFVIPNKHMILLIGKNSIEQLELNTWKRVSKLIDDEFNFEDKDISIVGNNHELYMFDKEDIYKFEKTF